MGGRPKAHASSDEFELGYYRLNLSEEQLTKVAEKLDLPAEHRSKLEIKEGFRQPNDGQEIMVTFKGRYVRITYQEGKAVRITPEDAP